MAMQIRLSISIIMALVKSSVFGPPESACGPPVAQSLSPPPPHSSSAPPGQPEGAPHQWAGGALWPAGELALEPAPDQLASRDAAGQFGRAQGARDAHPAPPWRPTHLGPRRAGRTQQLEIMNHFLLPPSGTVSAHDAITRLKVSSLATVGAFLAFGAPHSLDLGVEVCALSAKNKVTSFHAVRCKNVTIFLSRTVRRINPLQTARRTTDCTSRASYGARCNRTQSLHEPASGRLPTPWDFVASAALIDAGRLSLWAFLSPWTRPRHSGHCLSSRGP